MVGMTAAGVVTGEFPLPTGVSGVGGITKGPDGALWFVENFGNKIGRLPSLLAATHDFNADGHSDIVWRDTGGNVAIWEMNGTTVLNPNTAGGGKGSTTPAIPGAGHLHPQAKSGPPVPRHNRH